MSSGTGTPPDQRVEDAAVGPASLLDALLVYAEPLAAGAHVVVLGDASNPVAERLLDLGARGVHVFDRDELRAMKAARVAPRGVTIRVLTDDLDVRDGAFDLAVVPDLAALRDARAILPRLRRAVARSGAVVAMGRAKVAEDDADEAGLPFGGALGPAMLEYAELYELFSAQFDEVTLAGVLPFTGVVFAELGGEGESPAVSVDTRLAPSAAPSVFVIVAGDTGARHSQVELDPYAIVQVPSDGEPLRDGAVDAAFAAERIKTEVLAAQLEEAHDRAAAADTRAAEALARLARAAAERDGALTRARELETVLSASQQTIAVVEGQLLEVQRGVLDRDEQIATLTAEIETIDSTEAPTLTTDIIDVHQLIARAERSEEGLAAAIAELSSREDREQVRFARAQAEIADLAQRTAQAEASLALNVADVAHVAEAHAAETASYEEQLRDRARVIASLEKELVRREQLVKELVQSLEESREGSPSPVVFEAAAPLSAPGRKARAEAEVPDAATANEIARLRRKLDELALEIARREGELAARAWRISELESKPAAGFLQEGNGGTLEVELGRARDELDALRQALAQEHTARVAAESGEELARARSELARQSALLEQMRGRQARDGTS